MWIRSQSKIKIIDVDFVIVNEENYNQYVISGMQRGDKLLTILGTYTTEKKALSVLDEIELFIQKINTTFNQNGKEYHPYSLVFKMPQESDI